jgi:hypothetical protein
MARIVVEQEFSEPITAEAFDRIANRIDPCLGERTAAWRRSYISEDRTRVTCEFDAPDAESVREAFRIAGVPFVRIWAAKVLAVEDFPELQEKLADRVKKRT